GALLVAALLEPFALALVGAFRTLAFDCALACARLPGACLAALLDELAPLLPLLIELPAHPLVQAGEARLVARRPEERRHAIEHPRSLRTAERSEARLVGTNRDIALLRADLGLAGVHAVVGARVAELAPLGYHERLMLGAAYADRRRGRAHDGAVPARLGDPPRHRAERALQEPDDRAIVGVALRAEVHDAHTGAGAHGDVAAVFHAQMHLAIGAGHYALSLVDGVADRRTPYPVGG